MTTDNNMWNFRDPQLIQNLIRDSNQSNNSNQQAAVNNNLPRTRNQIHTITIKTTTNNQPPNTNNNNPQSSNNESNMPIPNIPQSNQPSTSNQATSFPLPKVNDPSFRSKWNSRSLGNNCGVSLDTLPNVKQMDYIRAIGTFIDPKKIVSIGKNAEGRLLIFFSNEQSATEVILKGVEVQNQHINALPVYIKPLRILISGIPPHTPDEDITNYLKQYGKLTSSLKPIPINADQDDLYRHILSHRREIYIQPDDSITLPARIKINIDDVIYVLSIETELTCYKCKQNGHMVNSCPQSFPTLEERLNNRSNLSNIPTAKIPEQAITPLTNIPSEQLPQNSILELSSLSPVLISGEVTTSQSSNPQQNIPNNSKNSLQISQNILLEQQQITNSIPNETIPKPKQQKQPKDKQLITFATPEPPIASTSRTSSADVFIKESKTATEKRKSEEAKTVQQKISKGGRFEELDDNESLSDGSIRSLEFEENFSNDKLTQLLKDVWHKQSTKKIKEVLMNYAEDVSTIIPHLQVFREYTINNSTKPQNQVSRIDRLVTKINEIIASKGVSK